MVLIPVHTDILAYQRGDLAANQRSQFFKRTLFRVHIEMRLPFVNLLVIVAANLLAHISGNIRISQL